MLNSTISITYPLFSPSAEFLFQRGANTHLYPFSFNLGPFSLACVDVAKQSHPQRLPRGKHSLLQRIPRLRFDLRQKGFDLSEQALHFFGERDFSEGIIQHACKQFNGLRFACHRRTQKQKQTPATVAM